MTVHCREEIYTEGGKRGGSGGVRPKRKLHSVFKSFSPGLFSIA